MRLTRWLAIPLLALLSATPTLAGGAWVPTPGEGDLQLGWSRKRAISSWDAQGDLFVNRSSRTALISYHDFRYAYVGGEIGLLPRLSTRFLTTYLDGYEGARQDLERNKGASDAWFGLKYALRQDEWPMAVAFTVRTSLLYDLPGEYDRHLFDENGNFRGVSSEWRGLLKEDYSLTYLVSRSFHQGRGWSNLELGYTYREGSPSDEVPVFLDVGYPLPWRNLAIKGTLVYVQAVGNNSPSGSSDRFGTNSSFNNASMARSGVSLYLPFGGEQQWGLEGGFNRWFWGRGARQYEEPFVSLGYRF